MIRKCVVCGKEFEGQRNKIYCSEKCMRLAVKARLYPKETRTCAVCGKEFETAHKTKMTCSKECSRALNVEYNSKKQRESRRWLRPKQKKVCEICGKEFETAYQRKKACSPECSLELERRRKNNYERLTRERSYLRKVETVCKCKECGREINAKNKHFCSEECETKNLYRQQNLYSETTFIWLKDFVRQSWSRVQA